MTDFDDHFLGIGTGSKGQGHAGGYNRQRQLFHCWAPSTLRAKKLCAGTGALRFDTLHKKSA